MIHTGQKMETADTVTIGMIYRIYIYFCTKQTVMKIMEFIGSCEL